MRFVKKAVIVLMFFLVVCVVSAEDVEEVSVYKGSTFTLSDFPLKIKYVEEQDSGYVLEVDHTEDDSCEKVNVVLSRLASYVCNEDSYVFEFIQPSRNMIKFSVKKGVLEEQPEEVEEEEEEEIEEEEEEKVVTHKTVSLCEGCMVGESCIKEGVQKQEFIGGPLYYCGPDGKAELVKDIGDNCMADYECKYYFCNNGYCNAKMEGENTKGILMGVFVGVLVIVLIVVFFLYKFGIGFKKIAKEEEKMEKEQKKKPAWQTSVKGIKRGGPYKYRPEFDVLEKKMKERLKR